MKEIIRYWNKPSRSAYVFLAPSIILLTLFSVIPLLIAFALSLFDVPITMDSATFIGIENFVEAFSDSRFLNSLKVTAIFTLLEVPLQVFGALVIAAFITKNNMKNKFLRAVYFLPVICSATAIGIMWKMILHSNIGFVTAVLQTMGLGKINFLNTPGLTIFVVSFIFSPPFLYKGFWIFVRGGRDGWSRQNPAVFPYNGSFDPADILVYIDDEVCRSPTDF